MKTHKVLNNCASLSAALALGWSWPAAASEGGQTHYPVGVDTIMNAALPGPGDTSFYSYSQDYESSYLADEDGRSLDPNFKASVQAEAFRVIHNWGKKLGPFYIVSGAIAPITRVSLTLFGRHDTSVGLSDLVISPVYLYYVNKTGSLFTYFGPDVYLPVGKYNKSRLANNGLHYWAIAPNAHVTWLPTKRLELSTTIYSEFNARNHATDYKSGSSLSADGVVAYRAFNALPKLKLAVQGYVTKQFTNDRQYGLVVGNGNKGQAFALGPQVSYDIANARGGILLKYQREFGVENRTRGNRFWFEIAFPI